MKAGMLILQAAQVLDKVDLNDATLQHVLFASTPLLPDSAMPQVGQLATPYRFAVEQTGTKQMAS